MRRALGKGLAQLLGQQEEESSSIETALLSAISPNPRQPRKDFDDESLNELAESIKQIGVMQPIIVRHVADEKYEIIAGERRWRAAQIAGLTEVPIVIRSADALESLQLALIENIQREDISALESAEAYAVLISEYGLTQEDVAQRVGKSRPSVANALRLLRLPRAVRDALSTAKITEGHARALLQFDTEAEQLLVLEQILEHGLTVRDVERIAQGKNKPLPPIRKKEKPLETTSPLDTALSEFFGSPSKIVKGTKGGKIEVEYFSDEDLMRIIENLGIRL